MNLECGCPSHHEHGPEGAAGCPICTPRCWYCNAPRNPAMDTKCPCGAPPEMPEGFMP